ELPREQLPKLRQLKIVEGKLADFESRKDAALVGSAVAQRRRLSVGQRFSIGEVKVTIVGVFTAPTASEENFIYTDLDFLQRTPGLHSVGIVTQLEVRLTPNANPDEVAKKIDEHFRGSSVQTDSRPKGGFQANAVSDFVELLR